MSAKVVKLTQGEVLKVLFTFQYKTPDNEDCRVRATLGDLSNPAANGSQKIQLPVASDFTTVDAEVFIETSSGGILSSETPPGTYDLTIFVEENTDIIDTVPLCVTVIKKLGMLESMIPMVLLMMMMGMMIPMMKTGETTGGQENG